RRRSGVRTARDGQGSPELAPTRAAAEPRRAARFRRRDRHGRADQQFLTRVVRAGDADAVDGDNAAEPNPELHGAAVDHHPLRVAAPTPAGARRAHFADLPEARHRVVAGAGEFDPAVRQLSSLTTLRFELAGGRLFPCSSMALARGPPTEEPAEW